MAACGLEARTPGPLPQTGTAQGGGGPPGDVMCITRPGRGEAEAKKTGRKAPVDSTEDDYDDLIGQACVRDLKAGRTHIVPDEEMDAILRKIRG